MRLPIKVRAILFVIGLSFTLGFLHTPGVGAESGGIGGRPASPDSSNPRTQSIFIYTLNKGASKSDQLLLVNGSNTTQTINLYAVDGLVTNTGAYTCQQDVEVPTGVGKWITLSTSSVTLAAQQTKKIAFSITIPSTADVGEHDGCLVFQSANDQGVVEGNIRVQTRQAIRVVATVPGKLQRTISITSFGVSQKNDQQQFALNLQNQGNVSADVNSYVTLKNIFGSTVFKDGGGYPVLPGDKLGLTFSNTKALFFGGWYHAQASIAYDDRAGTFGISDPSHLLTKTSKIYTIFVTPEPLAIGLYALIIVVVLGTPTLFFVQRRQRRIALREWSSITTQEGDTITDIARKYHITWKKLAAVNSIRPPYALQPGTVLKVPHPSSPDHSPKQSKES